MYIPAPGWDLVRRDTSRMFVRMRSYHTFVCLKSSDEKSMWKGRPVDLTMSICNRVEPFARTTLGKSILQ